MSALGRIMGLRQYAGCDKGQAIVETAILAPFLMIMLVSIIDIGRLEQYNTIVGHSARAAALYGAQNLTTAVDNSGMTAAGQSDATNNLKPLTGLLVSPTTVCKCSDGSNAICTPPSVCPTNTHMLTYVSVTSTYTFTTLFKYHVIPSTYTLKRTEMMQVAQ
jgi:Flp pilus assembly protein TadG